MEPPQPPRRPRHKKLVHELSKSKCNSNPKRSMADIRKEKISQAIAEQKLKKEAELSNKVLIRRPFAKTSDGKIQQTTPIFEEFVFEKRQSNYRTLRTDPRQCYCNRPQSDLWCLMCGHLIKESVQVTCPQHSNDVNVNKIVVCPNPECRAPFR